jgi:hypothetical protein
MSSQVRKIGDIDITNFVTINQHVTENRYLTLDLWEHEQNDSNDIYKQILVQIDNLSVKGIRDMRILFDITNRNDVIDKVTMIETKAIEILKNYLAMIHKRGKFQFNSFIKEEEINKHIKGNEQIERSLCFGLTNADYPLRVYNRNKIEMDINILKQSKSTFSIVIELMNIQLDMVDGGIIIDTRIRGIMETPIKQPMRTKLTESCMFIEPDSQPQIVLDKRVEPDSHLQLVLDKRVEPDSHLQLVLDKRVEPDSQPQIVLDKRVEPDSHLQSVLNKRVEPDSQKNNSNNSLESFKHHDTIKQSNVQNRIDSLSINQPKKIRDTEADSIKKSFDITQTEVFDDDDQKLSKTIKVNHISNKKITQISQDNLDLNDDKTISTHDADNIDKEEEKLDVKSDTSSENDWSDEVEDLIKEVVHNSVNSKDSINGDEDEDEDGDEDGDEDEDEDEIDEIIEDESESSEEDILDKLKVHYDTKNNTQIVGKVSGENKTSNQKN